MLVMEYKILPVATEVGSIGGIGLGGSIESAPTSGGTLSAKGISYLFLALLLSQGLFTGLVIGKLAEGQIKAGIKHSFIMMISAFLIFTGTGIIFGDPIPV